MLSGILETVQNELHDHNLFIQDFLQIKDIPEEDIGQGKIVISAKKRPAAEHERRYNEQHNLQEVSKFSSL